jgi:hypothetical protein
MIETFVPCRDFNESCEFYAAIGFSVSDPVKGDTLTASASYPTQGAIILQDYYVKDWAENTMMTIEVPELGAFIDRIQTYQSSHPKTSVRFQDPKDYGWGLQIHLLDPSGVLWHVFETKKSQPVG